ncbi:hypothetical protein ACDH70_20650 [Xanthomonas axonopodis pv. poinsettiicola]|nr:hypothetical protein [Xanthomonas codiaei]
MVLGIGPLVASALLSLPMLGIAGVGRLVRPIPILIRMLLGAVA